jgi:predicted methyltransferase
MDPGRYTVYAIEATVHAPTWEGVYSEILKVLKPGGVVSTELGLRR